MDEDYSAEEAAFAAACEMSTGPSERGSGDVASSRGSTRRSSLADNDLYWPPPRERLARTTIEIFSLHNLPKVNPSLHSHGDDAQPHRPHVSLEIPKLIP
jgi:hypothetical protein